MIKNIIFDLGGVLLNLDAGATKKAFEDLGLIGFDKHFTFAQQSGIFDAFDCGNISENDFRLHLKSFLPDTVTDNQIDSAWNAMLLNLPKERLDLLKSLGKKYRLFLLSNTNEIHIAAFSKYLKREYGFSDFSDYFEHWYYSCRIGKRKPHQEIFEFVLAENGLIPEETLFIDDSLQHVEGARKVGLHAYRLLSNQDIISIFKDIDIIKSL